MIISYSIMGHGGSIMGASQEGHHVSIVGHRKGIVQSTQSTCARTPQNTLLMTRSNKILHPKNTVLTLSPNVHPRFRILYSLLRLILCGWNVKASGVSNK